MLLNKANHGNRKTWGFFKPIITIFVFFDVFFTKFVIFDN